MCRLQGCDWGIERLDTRSLKMSESIIMVVIYPVCVVVSRSREADVACKWLYIKTQGCGFGLDIVALIDRFLGHNCVKSPIPIRNMLLQGKFPFPGPRPIYGRTIRAGNRIFLSHKHNAPTNHLVFRLGFRVCLRFLHEFPVWYR